METFEVHITGDEKIHAWGKPAGSKTIAIDLLKPDGKVLRTEHMTSDVWKFPNYLACKRHAFLVADCMKKYGVDVKRIKIESPFYEHYADQSLYIESHFKSDKFEYPTSKNQNKSICLATDREYGFYGEFIDRNCRNELELCLFDTWITEDKDWFELYES